MRRLGHFIAEIVLPLLLVALTGFCFYTSIGGALGTLQAQDHERPEHAPRPVWSFSAAVANPRSITSGGWCELTVPVPEAQEHAALELRTTPHMPAYLGPLVARGVRIAWLYVPALEPLSRLGVSVDVWPASGPGPGTEDPAAPDALLPEGGFEREAWVPVSRDIPTRGPDLVLTTETGDEIRWPLTSGQPIELRGDGVVPVYRWRGRIPQSMLVADFFLRWLPGRVLRWELMIQASDPSTTALIQPLEQLRLEAPAGVVPVVHDALAMGAQPLGMRSGRWAWQLLGDTHLADAQGQAWRGSFILFEGAKPAELPNLAGELEGELIGMALPAAWQHTGRWGPWGVLPTMHPGARPDAAYRNELERYVGWSLEHGGDPWAEPRIGLSKRPANTGDQEDFGATSLAPVMALPRGGPLALIEARVAAFATARRRGYERMPDGGLLRCEQLPDLVYWGQLRHYHPGVSPDQRGKIPWAPAPPSHGWYAWDNEHCSLNGLCGTYLLTGSPLLRQLIQQNVEAWLLGATTRPGWPTTGRGAPRSVGRTLLAMSWAYVCVDDSRILDRMKARVASSFADLLETSDEIAVLGVHGADGRKLGGRSPFWMPWQEALGLYGLDAAWQVTGDVRYRELALKVATTLTKWGWWEGSGGKWRIGDAVRYAGPEPLPLAAYRGANGDQVADSRGTDFDRWAYGGMKIARRLFREESQSELESRAEAILQAVRGDAVDSETGFWRLGRWGAVR